MKNSEVERAFDEQDKRDPFIQKQEEETPYESQIKNEKEPHRYSMEQQVTNEDQYQQQYQYSPEVPEKANRGVSRSKSITDAVLKYMFIFLFLMIFSCVAMYGTEKKNKICMVLYRNILAVYTIGFIVLFIVVLVDLIRKNSVNNYAQKTQNIVLSIISLPFSVWMGISFLIIRDTNKEISQN